MKKIKVRNSSSSSRARADRALRTQESRLWRRYNRQYRRRGGLDLHNFLQIQRKLGVAARRRLKLLDPAWVEESHESYLTHWAKYY